MMSHLSDQQSKDHFKKAVRELAYISGMTDQIHYSIDDRPDICAQAVASLIKADQRDQAWKGSFAGQTQELRDRLKEAMEEMGRRVKESLSQEIYQAFSGTAPDLNGDQFSPGCFGMDMGTGPHIIRPKSVTKPGKTYDEHLRDIARKIKR